MKSFFLQLLHSSGINRLARLWPSEHLTIVNFHRIREGQISFYDDMIELSAANFREQIEWLAQRVDFLEERDLAVRPKPGRPKMLLTFDDGYRDAFEVVAPVLTNLGIPAIFFVSPGLIDDQCLGSWDRIAYLVKKSDLEIFEFRGKRYDLRNGKTAIFRDLAKIARLSLPEQSQPMEEELSRALAVEPASHELMREELMSWDQLRALKKAGFSIGGHGMHHRPLSSLFLEEQESEIFKTKNRLLEEGLEPKSFAFPFGSSDSYSWETREMTVRAGFEFVFSFSGYATHFKKFDPTRLDRVPFMASREKYSFLLAFPRIHNLFQWLRGWEWV